MLRIGYHVSISGSLDLAFDRAREIGCTTMQIFLSNPRGWSVRELDDREVEEFKRKEGSFGIKPVFAHMPYLPNLASPRKEVYEKSIGMLDALLDRCEALRVGYLIAHLGSHLGEGKEAGLQRVSEAIRSTKRKESKTVVLLENEAGQRNSVGSQIEDLLELHDRIAMPNLGFCLDTCHLFAAGYDIRKAEVVDDVVGALGFGRIGVVHLNDAKHELGSGLDRHENIGSGKIGRSGFETWFARGGVAEKPMIMETPLVETPKEAIRELVLVRKIIGQPRAKVNP